MANPQYPFNLAQSMNIQNSPHLQRIQTPQQPFVPQQPFPGSQQRPGPSPVPVQYAQPNPQLLSRYQQEMRSAAVQSLKGHLQPPPGAAPISAPQPQFPQPQHLNGSLMPPQRPPTAAGSPDRMQVPNGQYPTPQMNGYSQQPTNGIPMYSHSQAAAIRPPSAMGAPNPAMSMMQNGAIAMNPVDMHHRPPQQQQQQQQPHQHQHQHQHPHQQHQQPPPPPPPQQQMYNGTQNGLTVHGPQQNLLSQPTSVNLAQQPPTGPPAPIAAQPPAGVIQNATQSAGSQFPHKPQFGSTSGIDPASINHLQAQFGPSAAHATSVLAGGAPTVVGGALVPSTASLKPLVPALPSTNFQNSLHPQAPASRPIAPRTTAESTMTQQQREAIVSLGITHISSVPANQATALLPPLSEQDMKQVRAWMDKDLESEADVRAMKERLSQDWSTVISRKARWFERELRDPPPGEKFSIIWPSHKKGTKKARLQAFGRIPYEFEKPDPRLAEEPELLVPIRIDVDVLDGGNRLRETFVWNANDPYAIPQSFARTMCEDMGVAPPNIDRVATVIAQSINEQVADYKTHRPKTASSMPTAPNPPSISVTEFKPDLQSTKVLLPPPTSRKPSGIIESSIGRKRSLSQSGSGVIEGDESEWWERWRKRLRGLDGTAVAKNVKKATNSTSKKKKGRSKSLKPAVPTIDDQFKKEPGTEVEVPKDEFTEGILFVKDEDEEDKDVDGINFDLRVPIKIDICAGTMRLEDNFEWDIFDEANSPELFAERYSRDLGLSGDFKTAIAHSIREQVQVYEKSLYLINYPNDGTKIQDEELRMAFLPSLYSARRPLDQVPTYTPQLSRLVESEMERVGRDDKKKRRQPRGRRGGAVPLPDREPLRTYRTPPVGFQEPEREVVISVAPKRAAALAAEKANAQIAVNERDTEARVPGQPYYGGHSPTMGSSHLSDMHMVNLNHHSVNHGGPSKQQNQQQQLLDTKRTRQEKLKGPQVAPEMLRSRPLAKSTAIPSEQKVPEEWLQPKREASTKQAKRRVGYRERELPEGQHENMIDGIWHCSNCGCPEDVAIGRRQGPLGPKTMCGQCGKWWHRHRKPLEVDYRTEKEYHLEKRRKEEEMRKLKKRGGMKAFQAAQAAGTLGTPSATPGRGRPISKRPSNNAIFQSPESSLSPPAMSPPMRPRRIAPRSSQAPDVSPVRPGTTPTPAAAVAESSTPAPPSTSNGPPSAPVSHTPRPVPAPTPDVLAEILAAPPPTRPAWLGEELARLRAQHPDDIFDVLQRNRPVPPNSDGSTPAVATVTEWRVRCTDCPGKLYNPGPEETLTNFEVHLRNRHHRARVDERIGRPPSTQQPASSAAPSSS